MQSYRRLGHPPCFFLVAGRLSVTVRKVGEGTFFIVGIRYLCAMNLKRILSVCVLALVCGLPLSAQHEEKSKSPLPVTPKSVETVRQRSAAPKGAGAGLLDAVADSLAMFRGEVVHAPAIHLRRQPWTKADSLDAVIQQLGHEQQMLDAPDGIGVKRSGVIEQSGALSFYGAGVREELPGMFNVRSALLGMQARWGAVDYRLESSVNRYSALGVITQYGVGGSLTWHLNDNLSATLYGTWYNRNPYVYMAAFPFMKATNYGGYLSAWSGRFGFDVGARRYYDPFAHSWQLAPIVTPKFKVSNKFTLELPVGDLLRDVVSRIVERHRNGPVIMPQPFL